MGIWLKNSVLQLNCFQIFCSGTDDFLVVVGGFGSQQNLVDVAEKYDFKSNTWSKLPVRCFCL